jgi:Tfp pilus assembly protein PilF
MAIIEFSRFIEYAPKFSKFYALAYNKRAYSYYRKYKWWECVEDNTKALQIDSSLYQAYRDRAEAYQNLNLLEDAKSDLKNYELYLRISLIEKKNLLK